MYTKDTRKRIEVHRLLGCMRHRVHRQDVRNRKRLFCREKYSWTALCRRVGGVRRQQIASFRALLQQKLTICLHLDADDWLMGEFDPQSLSGSKADVFMLTLKRGSSDFKASVIYNNRLRWKYIGVAHNIIKCLDKDYPTSSDMFARTETWVDATTKEAFRSLDPK